MWTFLFGISTALAYNNLSTYIDTPISDIVFLLDGKEITHNNLYHQKGETLDLYDIRQELEQLYATNRYKSIDISMCKDIYDHMYEYVYGHYERI